MPGSETELSPKARFSSWMADELNPQQVIRSLNAGFLIYLLVVIVVISYGALIFSGDLAGQIHYGIGLFLAGNAVLCAVIALFSSYPGSIGVEQDAPAAILALVAASLVAMMPADTDPGEQFSTVVVMIIGTALVTGLFFLLLGYFRLGGLVRYLPYPVMGGFLAGTGWLLLMGAIGVMVGQSPDLQLIQSDMLLRWLPGLLLGVFLLVAINRSSNPLVLPALFFGAVALFYLCSWLLKVPFAQLSEQGWLLGPFRTGSLWQFPLNTVTLSQVNWQVLVEQFDNLAPILIVSVISLLLNANGLELVTKRDIHLNRELIVAGAGNMLAAFGGGIVGYHTISLSSLNHTMSGGKRLPGLMAAILFVLTLFLSATLLSYLPKMVLGALIAFIGLSLLFEWVYRAWLNFPRIDFLIVLAILGVIALQGFLVGIALGLVLTIVLFVVSYSRINVVRNVFSGATYHSRVIRSTPQQKLLEAHDQELYILQLQGFVFFGTANNLYEQVGARTRQADLPPMHYVVLDFTRVPGIDTTGLLSFTKILLLAEERCFTVVLTSLNQRTRQQFTKEGILGKEMLVRVFSDLDRGVEWCENEILAREAHEAVTEKSLVEHFKAILPIEQISKLVAYMERREVVPGECLIRQGDEADFLILIESGQVTAQYESADRDPIRFETMGGGRSVGELGFYLGTRRNAAVLADEPSVVYILSKEKLEYIERTDPEVAHALHRIIVNILGERVIHLNQALEALQR